jgi:hypothetical protein
MLDKGVTSYELWYSIEGVEGNFDKLTIDINDFSNLEDARCYSFYDYTLTNPYVFFVYLKQNDVCDVQDMADFMKHFPASKGRASSA